MPAAMIAGAAFSGFFERLSWLTPYLIFAMLVQTYCGLSLKDIRFSTLHGRLLLIQFGGGLLLFYLLRPIDPLLAQGAMMCVMAPTAISAAVITGMLRGNVAWVIAFSLVSNFTAAILTPVIFTLVTKRETFGFFASFWPMFVQLSALLLLPLLVAIIIRRAAPNFAMTLRAVPGVSFLLWTLALAIVTGKTLHFLVQQQNGDYLLEIVIAFAALIVCLMQFVIGRKLGARFDESVATGQSLGQKNTVLAIWMAQTYLHPMAAVGPGAYILWQNMVNSYQLWKKRKTG